VPFDYTYLSSDQKTALGTAEDIIKKRINFIKGEEVAGFRSRPNNNKLADIVHSSPIYENDVVYVGANDGMLHAFNAKEFELTAATRYDLGEEIFAYIPSFVFDNFIEFTSPGYGHKYFVDQTPTIRAGAGILENKPPVLAAANQTILVGGLGKGGRGVYALDITAPFAMNSPEKVAANVLWEYPVNSDDDMGYSFSKPVVVQSRDSLQNPWIVIFGNGYGSPNGDAALYILNPAKSPGNGLLVKKIVLGGGPDNGLSGVTPVDINFDRKVDYVYAGDLKGNLWKFDLTSTAAGNWDVAFNDSNIQPLFQARGPDGKPQPITSKPEVTFHNTQHGYMVLFGTGKFLGEDDFSETQIQTVYGIWDYGDDADDTEYLGALIRDSAGNVTGLSNLSAATLQKQEISDFAYAFDNGTIADVRLLTQNELEYKLENDTTALQFDNPSSSEENDVGWYFDLSTRERVDTDVLLREGRLIVLGFKPDEYRCRPGGGVTMFMEVDAFTGGNLFEVVFDADSDNSLGGTISGGDIVKIWDDALKETIKIPPSGMLFLGKLHSPAILLDDGSGGSGDGGDGGGGGGSGGRIEYKYMSTSAGDIRKILEKAVVLGIGNWRELHR
jgi:type IV pilus assembly protein PilY1